MENARKVSKRIRRIRGKYLSIYGEDAKRILAYSPNTPKDIKVCISRLIIIQILKNFGFFLSKLYGMDLAKKTISRYCPFKGTPQRDGLKWYQLIDLY